MPAVTSGVMKQQKVHIDTILCEKMFAQYYHSVSFVAIRCHSFSSVATRCTTRCHSMYHSSVFL